MRRLGDQRGQAAAVVVLLIAVLVAMAAVAIDVGAWYVAKRSVQNAADAAALAGAARLPNGTPAARSRPGTRPHRRRGLPSLLIPLITK
jgi:uncharacterized membrane protein